jgi:hypothetical protein
MVAATVMGAMAYDLSDYPEPLVKNGVFNGNIVIGKTAQVSDVIGAIDIAASLQAAAVTPVEASGSTSTVSVTGGVQLKSSSEDFNFGDKLNDFATSGIYDSDDFPDLLADGTLEDDDGTEYDYEQTIKLPAAAVKYGQDDNYGDDPVFYVDLATGNPAIIYSVEFDTAVNVTELTDSESIEMFGKVYTFDPNHALGDDLTLFGSDVTVTVTQNEPQTVKMEGEEYKIEILGGNTGDSSAIIRVTSGSEVKVKTLVAGDSRNMAGLDLFVDDVFISDIGEDTISVSIFVGSEKIIIPDTAVDNAADTYKEITIGTEDNTDIYAWVESSAADDLGAVSAIHFKITPSDFDDPALDEDEWNYLVMGNEYVDPLFGFSVAFEGMMPSVESRDVVSVEQSGDTYTLSFMNNDGDEYDFEIVEATATNKVAYGESGKFLGNGTTAGDDIAEDEFFILESSDAKVGERTSYIFEVRDVNTDDTEVTLKDIGTGDIKTYDLNDEIADTGVTIDVIAAPGIQLSADTNSTLIAKGGLVIGMNINGTAAPNEFTLTFTEDSEDGDEVASTDVLSVTITEDATDDIVMSTPTGFPTSVNDEAGDVVYGLSAYGTWYEQDLEDDNFLNVYYSGEETDFAVFLNGPDAVVVTSGSSNAGEAYVLNEMVIGQIAIYDDEALSMIGKTPLIAVGGPCVNDVARELMGNPEVCAEGFTDGKAMIKLWESQNAILVAGMSGEDTTGGAQVLAAYKDYALMGDEVEVITTDLKNLEVSSVN